MNLLESDGMKTLIILIFLFFALMGVGTADYAWSLVDEAREKEMKPLRMALEWARIDSKRTKSVLLACLNGRQIMLKDGNLIHFANCDPYKVREAFFVERQ